MNSYTDKRNIQMIINVLHSYCSFKGPSKSDIFSVALFMSTDDTKMYVSPHLSESQRKSELNKNTMWKYKMILDRLKDDSEAFAALNEFFEYCFVDSIALSTQYDKFFDKLWEIESKALQERIYKMRFLTPTN